MSVGWLQVHCDCAILQRGLRLPPLPPATPPPLIRRPATLLPWSPPKFIDAPCINPSTVLTQSLPPNSPQPLIKSSHLHMHALLSRFFPHLQHAIFLADWSHTPKCSHHNNRKRKKEKLLCYSSLKVDFAPSFWSFCLRSFDLGPPAQ